MEEDKISVIMTVYKESKEELKESFESIINQTYKNIEIILKKQHIYLRVLIM